MKFLLFCEFFCVFFVCVFASIGDNSEAYSSCNSKCYSRNCRKGQYEPSIILKLMQWSCREECQYNCMWETVKIFQYRGWEIPQFHGKWPFIRILGIQEPASVLFSLLNLYAHIVMIKKLRNDVRPDSPNYWLIHVYFLVCVNAWIWSTIFHTRDFPLTEFLDYICAFSIVLVNFYFMLMRILRNMYRSIRFLLTVFVITFFLSHVTYLRKKIDYGYNMKVNILVGTTTGVLWFAWCAWNRKRQPYALKCALFVTLAGLAMLLEVIDLPPIFWVFDCHALWHLATAFIVPLFYNFVIDDCKYLRDRENGKTFLSKLD